MNGSSQNEIKDQAHEVQDKTTSDARIAPQSESSQTATWYRQQLMLTAERRKRRPDWFDTHDADQEHHEEPLRHTKKLVMVGDVRGDEDRNTDESTSIILPKDDHEPSRSPPMSPEPAEEIVPPMQSSYEDQLIGGSDSPEMRVCTYCTYIEQCHSPNGQCVMCQSFY